MDYTAYTAPNGLILHTIKTPASNIKLLNLQKNSALVDSDYYGINGGWFNMSTGFNDKRTLNLAYCDGAPVGPTDELSDDGIIRDGSTNCVGKQALSFRENLLRFHDEEVIYASELPLLNKQGAWVQGGIIMHLGRQSDWALELNDWGYRSYSEQNGWSAIVGDLWTADIYLFVMRSATNAKNLALRDFRAGIMAYFGLAENETGYDRYGCMLHGSSSSSQMRAVSSSGSTVRVYNTNEKRPLCQIIALRDPDL